MAGVENKDIPEIYNFEAEFWKIIKKYWIVENTDEYWQGVIEDTNQLGRKYDDTFCLIQIRAYMDYLTEQYKIKFERKGRQNEAGS